MAPPTVDWVLPHQSVTKSDMPRGQPNGAISSAEAPSSQVTLVCVKLPKADEHRVPTVIMRSKRGPTKKVWCPVVRDRGCGYPFQRESVRSAEISSSLLAILGEHMIFWMTSKLSFAGLLPLPRTVVFRGLVHLESSWALSSPNPCLHNVNVFTFSVTF